MSHRQKLEQVLDLLINEETDAASEILHSLIVEKARTMYEELVDEDFGGDEKEDFADEIDSDKDEIELDATLEDEESDDEEALDDESFEDEDSEEEEIEDRVEDLEARFAELSAEFEALVGDEEGFEDEEGFGDEAEVEDEGFGDEFADDEGFEEEEFDDLEEATKLQDAVPSTGQDKEGKFSGTGKNSKIGATNVNAPFSRPTRKADHGGKPVQAKGGDEAGFKAAQGKESTPSDNIDAPQKKQSAKADGFVGTDKGSKKGAQNVKSPLGSGSSPKGV